MFKLIAFDADDTLWHNEDHYHEARDRFRQLMAGYNVNGSVDERADYYEVANIEYYGYGVMSFVLSLIEAAIELTEGAFRSEDVQALLDLSKEMLTTDVRVFDGVHDTLSELGQAYPLMLITKGDLLHQQNKVANSGLHDHFRYVEVVSHKTPGVYAEILERHEVPPEQFLMVGNSLRSDVLPVAELGAWAVHVPTEDTWAHEVIEMPDSVNGHVFEAPGVTHVPDLVRKLGS
ncbi:MAG TPA: HAD family hydrolase [Candidatus Sulfomarinibacteraceae bacterium]|nr:HAD family hydrolase [Candidatus Sulfomarinibacteraceae bacterium]